MARWKILHFRIWSKPPIAASVEKLLQDTFPDYELKTIMLWNLIKADKMTMLCNTLAVLKEYGRDILFGRLKFKTVFFRTTYVFNYVRGLAKKIGAQEKDILFTFQLQSIFDTQVEGVPNFIYTDHTHLANLYYSAYTRVCLFSAEWIQCEKTVYDHAERIYTRSSNISHSLIDQYGMSPEKVECIYAGANTSLVDIDPLKKDYSQKNILFVGLDWKRKGGPDLLEAFKHVLNNHPDARLTIVGCQVASSSTAVKSVGRVSVGELQNYYQKATIFCMPSLIEPFGVVFVEAMANALPIIATRTGAIPDMVVEGKNGLLVEPGDVKALTQAIDELLKGQKMRKRFGRESWQYAQDRYNWQTVGRRLRTSVMAAIKEGNGG